MSAIAQTSHLPKPFYRLKTNGEKAAYLTTLIADSVKISAYSEVPAWCHLALGLLKSVRQDSLSPILLQYLGDAYDGKQPDSAAYYYSRSLASYEKKIDRTKQLYLQQSLLYVHMALENKDSILFYIDALESSISNLPDDYQKKLVVSNTLASAYEAVNQYEDAIKKYKFVMLQALKLNDSLTLRNALVNIGTVYNQLGNDTMAVYYTRQALPYLGKENYAMLVIYANLVDYYSSINHLDSAKYFLKKVEAVASQMGDDHAIHSLGMRRAVISMMEKKYPEAEALLAKSLAYFEKGTPDLDLFNCLLVYAQLDSSRQNYAAAEEHLKRLYEISKKMNQKAYNLENVRMLAAINEKLGDYKDAYHYQTEFIAVNDSIRADKAHYDLAHLQAEYQTYRKEEQIAGLQRNRLLIVITALILLVTSGSLLYIRHLRNKAAMQRLKASLEMKALRSQMNPHFIFNSLNSIQKYIWENRQDDASDYLSKFARLIRMVLDNSLHASVTLADELYALQIYIELEHRRMNQRFDYSITVGDDVDADHCCVPPLLLQPYVENAIWHGLSHKDGHGKLDISITRVADFIECHIQDNGIGRERSAAIKTNETLQKSSLAMNISSQRISWLHKEAGMNASVRIIDHGGEALASGTTVVLVLPLIVSHD